MYRPAAFLRKAFPAALASLALGGCLGTLSSADWGGPDLARLAEQGAGVLVAHTSLHDEGCREVTATLAKPVVSGRVIGIGRTVTLKGRADPAAAPGYAVLPAGEYGIVRFACEGRGAARVYAAETVEAGSGDGIGTVYAAPLVTFRIGPGEIVDAGSVQLAGEPDGRFAVSVARLPEAWLQNLPGAYAALAGTRVVRPMAVPGRAARAEATAPPRL
ncbi:MAG TPA: hypothetical protein VHL98_04035 [Microvirga sp.]|jgi:hypothetical protein|nr:hypothetical protein [Microvirga sp.]